ncbi:MAG: TraR/DksA C4-type zinc finger protein [Candidatus Omnitrophica bacterium]|nr:TraR/DksA C4-type zinc finger protein [Candidatus Omnitrophota bacterium]
MPKSRKVKRVKKINKKKAKRSVVKIRKIKRMPRSDLKIYRALLLKEREKVGGELSHITENTLNKSARDASGDLSGYSYHMADVASDDYERDFSLGRATEEQKALYIIDEALKRVEEGTYGSCSQCGKLIPKTRLKVIPYADLCVECKKMNEK